MRERENENKGGKRDTENANITGRERTHVRIKRDR